METKNNYTLIVSADGKKVIEFPQHHIEGIDKITATFINQNFLLSIIEEMIEVPIKGEKVNIYIGYGNSKTDVMYKYDYQKFNTPNFVIDQLKEAAKTPFCAENYALLFKDSTFKPVSNAASIMLYDIARYKIFFDKKDAKENDFKEARNILVKKCTDNMLFIYDRLHKIEENKQVKDYKQERNFYFISKVIKLDDRTKEAIEDATNTRINIFDGLTQEEIDKFINIIRQLGTPVISETLTSKRK